MENNLKKYRYRQRHIQKELNHFAVHLKLTQHCKSTIFSKKKLHIKEKVGERDIHCSVGLAYWHYAIVKILLSVRETGKGWYRPLGGKTL